MRISFCVAAALVISAAGRSAFAIEGTSPASVKSISLPGARSGGVFLDYLAVDRPRGRIWVPASGTGRVDVIDAKSGTMSEVGGFPTAEVERKGQKRMVGPSSVSIGEGFVYVGDRADSTVCAVNAETFAKGGCVKLDSMPDGVAFVKSAREVWVTTPRNKAIVVLDASDPAKLVVKTRIALDGAPEGYAVDERRRLFYTNLEDLDRTLTLDIERHVVVHTWDSNCGGTGPKGLAVDAEWNLVLLACPDRVKVLDAGHGGFALSVMPTGAGLDDIDYDEARHELFAAAAKAAQLTIAKLRVGGTTAVVDRVPTAEGARNAVAASDGAVFVADGPHGRVLEVAPK